MGGLIIEIKGSRKQIHMGGESRACGNGQKETHSGGDVEGKVSKDNHHGG